MKTIAMPPLIHLAIPLTILLFSGCTSTPKSAPGTNATDTSPATTAALEYFCDHLLASGHQSTTTLYLNETPTPVVNMFLLRLKKDSGPWTPEVLAEDEIYSDELFHSSPKIPLKPPESSLCLWKTPPRTSSKNEFLVEYSPVLENPHAPSPTLAKGFFIRLSFGLLSTKWYWIIIDEVPNSTESNRFRVIPLDIDEN